jgi:mRNA interferase MazF
VSDYIPDEGDIVWLQLSPTIGREQAGHRPALVVSPARFNRRSRLMLCVPMTSRAKGYPFEVAISADRQGVALVDQARCVDFEGRGVSKKSVATAAELEQVREILRILVG